MIITWGVEVERGKDGVLTLAGWLAGVVLTGLTRGKDDSREVFFSFLCFDKLEGSFRKSDSHRTRFRASVLFAIFSLFSSSVIMI